MKKEEKLALLCMLAFFASIFIASFISNSLKKENEINKDEILCDTDSSRCDSTSNDTIYESGSTTHSRGHNSMDADDEEYWNSVNREKALRDAGQDRAADIEHQSRIEYLQGGGYHSKDGGSQVQFQGSEEQKKQLEEMDRMGW